MPRIGIFYGSTDGHTAAAAAELKTELDAFALPAGEEGVELFDIADYYLEEMLDFDCLVLGIPTWNHWPAPARLGSRARRVRHARPQRRTRRRLRPRRPARLPRHLRRRHLLLADELRQQARASSAPGPVDGLHLQCLLGRRRAAASRPRPRRTQPARPDRASGSLPGRVKISAGIYRLQL